MAIDGPLPKVSFSVVQDAANYLKINGLSDMQARSYGFNDGQDWERPEHYVRHVDVPEVELATQVEYDMDEQDNEWLEAVNSERRVAQLNKVSLEIFEVVMDRLEKEYFELQKAAGGGKDAEMAGAEDAQCAVCEDSEGENTNAIVFCDGCNLAVHQDCYGVPYIPEGQWLCRKCALSPEVPVSCALCPAEGGAFKQDNRGEWVHLLCAIWIPETSVMNDVFMEPILGTDKIPRQRWRLKCGLCDDPEGACIQCNNRNCYAAFHVTCARKSKLLGPMKASGPGMEAPQLVAFCEKHLPPERVQPRLDALAADAEKAAALARDPKAAKAARAHAKGYAPRAPLVPAIVVRRVERYIDKVKLRKSQEFVELVARYWSLKREARRGAPLLRRLHLETSSAAGRSSDEQERLDKLERTKALRDDLSRLAEMAVHQVQRERIKLERARIKHALFNNCLFPHAQPMRVAFERIRGLDKSDFFKHPVSRAEVPNYYDVIKNPMCWSIIDRKLDEHEYWDIGDFQADVQLVLDNAREFNPPSHAVHKAAGRIWNQARPLLEELNRFRTTAPNEIARLDRYGKEEEEDRSDEVESDKAGEAGGEVVQAGGEEVEVRKEVTPMEVDGDGRIGRNGEQTGHVGAKEDGRAEEVITETPKEIDAAVEGAHVGEGGPEMPMDVDVEGSNKVVEAVEQPSEGNQPASELLAGGGAEGAKVTVDGGAVEEIPGDAAAANVDGTEKTSEAVVDEHTSPAVGETPVPASVKELTPLVPPTPTDVQPPRDRGDTAVEAAATASYSAPADEAIAPEPSEAGVEMQKEKEAEVQITMSPEPIMSTEAPIVEAPTAEAPAQPEAGDNEWGKEKEAGLINDPKHLVGDLEPPFELLSLLRSAAVAAEAPVVVRGAPLDALFSFEMPVEKPRPAPPKRDRTRKKAAPAPRARRTDTPQQQAEAGPSRLPATPPPQVSTPSGTPAATTPGTSTARHRTPPRTIHPGAPHKQEDLLVSNVTDHASFLKFNEGWILPPNERRRARKAPPEPVPQTVVGKKRKRGGTTGEKDDKEKGKAASVGFSTPSVGGRAELMPATPGHGRAPSMEIPTPLRGQAENDAVEALAQLMRGSAATAPPPPPMLQPQQPAEHLSQHPYDQNVVPPPSHPSLQAPIQLGEPSTRLESTLALRGPAVPGAATPETQTFELRPIDEQGAQRWRDQVAREQFSPETTTDPSESIRGPSTLRGVSEATRGVSEVGGARHVDGERDEEEVAMRWRDVDGDWRLLPVSQPGEGSGPAPMEVDEARRAPGRANEPPQDEELASDEGPARDEEPAPGKRHVQAEQPFAPEDDAEADTDAHSELLEKAAKAEALDAADALADDDADADADADADTDAEPDESAVSTPPPRPLRADERLTHSPGGTVVIESFDSPAIRRQRHEARKAKAKEAEEPRPRVRTRSSRSSMAAGRSSATGKDGRWSTNAASTSRAQNRRSGLVLKQPEPDSEPEVEGEEAGPSSSAERARERTADEVEADAGLGSELSDLSDLETGERKKGGAEKDEVEQDQAEPESEAPAGKANEVGMVDCSSGRVPENTLVWAKMGSFPYYPARIVHPESKDVPTSARRDYREKHNSKKKRGRKDGQLVQFFDEGSDWGTVYPEKLRYMFRYPEVDKKMLSFPKRSPNYNRVHEAFHRAQVKREDMEKQKERDE